MIRFLVYSICLFGLFSCKSYQPVSKFIDKEQVVENVYFSDLDKEYTYAISVSAYKHFVSGILVVKAIDNNSHRVLMVTEFGNTLLDLTVTPFGYTKNYAMPDLDKKIILNLLSHDFFTLLHNNWLSTGFYEQNSSSIYKAQIKNKNYFLTYVNKELQQIEYARKKKKLQINFEVVNQNQAEKISLKHSNLDIKIELSSL